MTNTNTHTAQVAAPKSSIASVLRSIAVALAIALLSSASIQASEPVTFDRTLTVSGPVILDVKSDPGGIYVKTGTSNSVVVHAVVRPLYGRLDFEIAEANILALQKDPPIEQVGNTIRIGYPKDTGILRAVSVRYEIETPVMTELHAHTTSGGISVAGISGPVETVTSSGRTEVSDVKTSVKAIGRSGAIVIRNVEARVFARNESGGLQISSVRGSVDAQATNGRVEISDVGGDVRTSVRSSSIRIDKVKGSVEARNTSGSIDALQSSGAISAETTSGAIHISQESPAPIRAVARSGQIKVQLASGGGYMLDALSNSGKISGRAVAVLPKRKDAHSIKGQIGSGGPLVDLDTHSAKIEVD